MELRQKRTLSADRLTEENNAIFRDQGIQSSGARTRSNCLDDCENEEDTENADVEVGPKKPKKPKTLSSTTARAGRTRRR